MEDEKKPAPTEETQIVNDGTPPNGQKDDAKKSILKELKRYYIIVAVIYLTYKIYAYGCNYIGVEPFHVFAYVFGHTLWPISILAVVAVFCVQFPKYLGITLPYRIAKSKVGTIIISILFYGLYAYALVALIGDIYNESQTHKFVAFSLYKNFCN